EAGLMTPATWPLAPSTKRISPSTSCVVAYAVRHGTMWSSRVARTYAGSAIFRKSTGTPSTDAPPGSRSLFSREGLRTYQQYIGPGRFVESEFQYSRSNASGDFPFR